MKAHTVSRLLTARGADANIPSVIEEFQYADLPD